MAMPRSRGRITGLSANTTRSEPFQLVSNEDWMIDAACADTAPRYDLFFPENSKQEREAKEHCATCPVTWECFEFSIRNREIWGIWGGMTLNERADLMDKYRGPTRLRALQAAHERHITELNQQRTSNAHRPQRLGRRG